MDPPVLSTLEPDLLRAFVAIADTGSFTAAAARVLRTQSAVSMQIKRLEEQLGQALFRREARVVALTRAGELLLGHARRILQAHQEAIAAFDPEALEGGVRFGVPDDYATSFLPHILARFAATHPKVHVEVVCETSRALLARLAAGQVDMALVTQGSGESGGVLLHRDRLVWAVSRTHRVHEQEPLPLAVFDTDCIFRRYATAALAAAGRSSRVAYTSVSIAGIYAALDAGLAVSPILVSNLRPGLRVLTPEEGFPPLPAIGITLQRGDAPAAPVLERLEAHVVAAFEARSELGLAA